MSDKPKLSILAGDAWQAAIAAEEAAQEAGVEFSLPNLEAKFEEGASVKVFDRTNAVFYLGLFQASPGADLKELEPLAAAPRSMFILAGLADIEAKLAGDFHERSGVPLTGAPEEQDGLENYLSQYSATAWLSKERERFLITLRGVDYEKLDEIRTQPGYDPKAPQPELDETFSAPTLKNAYIAACRFGELVRERRYRGQVPPPLRAPALLPDGVSLGPRSRPSDLADRGL